MQIIALAPNEWEGMWVNRQQLLSRMAARHTVVYSNGPWFTWDRVRPEWGQAPLLGTFRHTDGVWVDRAPRVLMRNPRLGGVDRWVLRVHARRLARCAAQSGSGPRVLHVFHPAFAGYAALVAHDALVYHPYDWFERMPGWDAGLEAGEQKLLRTADTVIATSDFLARELARKWPRAVRVLHNGVDLTAYAAGARAEIPADLAVVPRPRLGYIGTLQPHIDFHLVDALARRHGEWHFVFVGIDARTAEDGAVAGMAECARRTNVHFLGPRSRRDVPRYAAHMDANLIPWALGAGWVDAGSPNKLQEYLAAGPPVVSAALQTAEAYADVLQIARSAQEWERAVGAALATHGPGTSDDRRRVAAENTWDRRVACLEGWLRELTAQAA